jgi:AcrR family transcriptional regulator
LRVKRDIPPTTVRADICGGGRNYAKGRAKRAEILDAATSAFAEVGYLGASLRDIASRARISHVGLVRYFPTKLALLDAAVEHWDAVEAGALARTLSDDDADYVEALMRHLEHDEARPTMVAAVVGLSAAATARSHPAHELTKRRYRRRVAQLTTAFEVRAERGGLAPGVDPAQAARTVVALIDGLRVQWLMASSSGSGRLDAAAHVRAVLSSVLVRHGLAP